MRILRVHINNLNSLRLKSTIDFTESPLAGAGIFAITGDTGAGKSTILDGITLALYGKIARSKDVKEVMSFGAVECHAEVEFAVRENRYLAGWRMHRARGKEDGNLIGPSREIAKWDDKKQEFIPIAEKIRDVDHMIEQIAGLDYERFSRSVLLSQGDFAAFLRSDERERSDLLERITGTEIYTAISIAAYDRYREENQQLEALQEQLRQLDLFQEELVTADQLSTQESTVQNSNNQLEGLRKRMQRFERWQQLQTRKTELEQEHVNLTTRLEASKEERSRFERSKQLRPLVGLLEEEKNLTDRVLDLKTQNEQLQAIQVTDSTALSGLDETHKKQEEQLRTLKEQLSERSVVWDKTTTLDRELNAIAERLAGLQAQLAEHNQELTHLEEQQSKQAQEQKNRLEEQADLLAWLKANKGLAGLAEALPGIEQLREQLLRDYQSLNKLQQEQLANQEAISKWEQQQLELAEALRSATERKNEIDQRFRSLLPEEFDPSEREAVQRLTQAIDSLQEQRRVFGQLAEMDKEYQQLLQEQMQYDERLQELLTQQALASKEVLSLVDQQEALRPDLGYKRDIYEQQQLIANYEKDRQSLKPGDPCPLCLSTDHPFHDHPVTPYVDKAKEELDALQQQAENLLLQERKWLREEAELNREIESLRGNELEAVQGRLQQHLQKIESYERRMMDLLTEPTDDMPTERGSVLLQRLKRVEGQLTNWQQVRGELEALSLQLTELRQEEQRVGKEQALAEAKLEASREQGVRLQEQQTQAEKQMQAIVAEANRALSPFDQKFDLETAKSMFSALRSQAKEYREKSERSLALERDLAVLDTQLENQAVNLEKQRAIRTKSEKEIAELAQRNARQKEERISLMGEKVVADEQAVFQESIDQQEASMSELAQQRTQLREKVVAQKSLIEEKGKEKHVAENSLAKIQDKLDQALKKLDFAGVSAARQALLSPEDEEAIEERLKGLDLQQAEWERSRKEWKQEDEQLGLTTKDVEEAKNLNLQIKEAEASLAQQQQQLGQLKEKYDQQEKRKQQHQSLLDRINQQRQVFNRWAQLNEVIGQADGKKFRTYAQGLTLQKLVALANHHLTQLNGRYLINKKIDADLALEIVDTYQADNRRSMFTLSGGETFLISLALALGLSDLAGRNVQIHSLFIDEGFGSLDENSLDLALSTLENLQSSGKTIGIISHVKLLKERIGTQLQVQKQSSGFSTLQVIG